MMPERDSASRSGAIAPANCARRRLASAIESVLIGIPGTAALACLPGLAFAGPSGGQVVGSGASILPPSGNTTTIKQTSQRAILNWQSFSIGANEVVRFNQPGSSAVALNRVVGANPSSILGQLSANGRVFLVNPRGVYFGPSARVDVSGLVASVFDITNENFLAGRYNFNIPGQAGATVINEGRITTGEGGFVVLAAEQVINTGTIETPGGNAVLAAGGALTVDLDGDGLISYEITAASLTAIAGVENTGEIIADGGLIALDAKRAGDLAATAVNQQGRLQARGITTAGGRIFLTAQGGNIVQGGTIDADTAVAGGEGIIRVQSDRDITLEATSRITASGLEGGEHSGGEIRVIADGTLMVRPDSDTRVDGGIDGGHGGFIEVSGRSAMSLAGNLSGRARAHGYGNGELYIDPATIRIIGGGTDSTGGDGIVLSSDSPGGTLRIDPANLSSAFATITLEATGDIDIDSTIGNLDVNDGVSGGGLVLVAGVDINVNAAIGSSGSPFDHALTLRADNDINVKKSIIVGTPSVSGATNLTIAANDDGSGLGDVIIDAGVLGNDIKVKSGGSIAVTGKNLSVLADAGDSVELFAGGNVDVDVSSDIEVVAGTASVGNANANARIEATGNIVLDAGGSITVQGGDVAGTVSSGSFQLNADAVVEAGGGVSLIAGGAIDIQGGSVGVTALAGASGSGSGTNSVEIAASAKAEVIASGGDVTLDAGGLVTVRGGDSAAAVASIGSTVSSGAAFASADASARVDASQDVRLKLGSGGLAVRGGFDAFADVTVDAATGSASAVVSATALVVAGRDVLTTTAIADSLSITGGSFGIANAVGFGTINASVNADAGIDAGRDVKVDIATGLFVVGGRANDAIAVAKSTAGSATATLNASARIHADALNRVDVGSVGSVTGGSANTARTDNPSTPEPSGRSQATLFAVAELSGQTVDLDGGSNFVVAGGDIVSVDVNDVNAAAVGTATADVSGRITATGTLTVDVTGELKIQGGNFASASGDGKGSESATGRANGEITGNDVTVTVGGGLNLYGGDAASATGEGTLSDAKVSVATEARAIINGSSSVTVDVTSGGISLNGGSSAEVDLSGAGSNEVILDVSAEITGGNIAINVAGGMDVNGGSVKNDVEGSSSSANNIGGVFANGVIAATGTLAIDVTSGGLSINGGSNAGAVSASDSGHVEVLAEARAQVSGQTVSVDVAGALTIRAGDGATARATLGDTPGAFQEAVADFSAVLTATGNLAVAMSGAAIQLRGGDSGRARGSERFGEQRTTVFANAQLTAGGNLAVSGASSLLVQAGNNGLASGSGSSPAAQGVVRSHADALVSAGNNATVVVGTGGISVQGGNDVDAKAIDNEGASDHQATARASIDAGGNLTISTTGGLSVAGGDNAFAQAKDGTSGANRATVNADAMVLAGNTLTVNANSVSVEGGTGNASASEAGINSAITSVKAELIGQNVVINTGTGGLFVGGGSSLDADASMNSVGDSQIAETDGSALIAAGGNLTINLGGGDLTIRGGFDIEVDLDDDVNGSGFASGYANGDGALTAVGNITIAGAGNVSLIADSLIRADFSDFGTGGSQIGTVQAGAKIIAGGSVSVAASGGISLTGGSAAAVSEGTVAANGVNEVTAAADAQIIAGADITLTAGGDITLQGGTTTTDGAVSAVELASATAVIQGGGLVVLAADGNVSNGEATIVADALSVAAGGNINLSSTDITVGDGLLTGLAAGDPFIINNMSGLGLDPPQPGPPSAAFAANGEVILGPLTLLGSYPYIVLSGTEISLTEEVNLPSATDILVQWRPPSDSQTVGIIDSPAELGVDPTDCGGSVCEVVFFNAGAFDQFPGTTHAVGSGDQSGTVAVLGPIDIGSQNLIFAGANILGLANITTSGIVGIVEALVAAVPDFEETVFIVPTVADDIGVSQTFAETLIEQIADSQAGEEGEDDETDEAVVEETGTSSQGDGLTTSESDSSKMCTA